VCCAAHLASIGGQCCCQAVTIRCSSSQWLLQPAALLLLLLPAGTWGSLAQRGPLAHTRPPVLLLLLLLLLPPLLLLLLPLLLLLLLRSVPPWTPSSPCRLHLYLSCCCCPCGPVCESSARMVCAWGRPAGDFVRGGHVPAADGALKGVQARVGGLAVDREVAGAAEGLCEGVRGSGVY
jgi:hypothetical protein